MSQENVELVRGMMDAFIEEDYERALSAFDANVEGDFTHMPEGQLVRGHEGITREVVRWQRTWDQFETSVEDVLDAGDEVVLLVHQSGVGKQSGLEAVIDYAQIFAIREGKIVRLKTYLDRDVALAAAGLDG